MTEMMITLYSVLQGSLNALFDAGVLQIGFVGFGIVAVLVATVRAVKGS